MISSPLKLGRDLAVALAKAGARRLRAPLGPQALTKSDNLLKML